MKLSMRISTDGDNGWWDDAEISDAVFFDLIKKSEIFYVRRTNYSVSITYSNPTSLISIYKDTESMKIIDIYMIIRNRND